MSMPKHPLVEIDSGYVQGLRRSVSDLDGAAMSSAAFLGIPFAAPPVGRLRFAAPRPVRPWDDTHDGTRYGATPLRETLPGTAIPEPAFPGESTLNVNVFTPTLDQHAKLPVLVYIHGGGYESGSPSGAWFDGRTFNRSDIVVVAISYRLGFEGFGWVYGAPHNRGLLDQIAALRWVQRNIAVFGGDPAQVTIAGQSAGGGSVLALVLSPLTTGLFARGIVQSGALPVRSLDEAERRGRRFAQRLRVDPTLDGLSTVTSAQVWKAQRAQAAEEQKAALARTALENVRRTYPDGIGDALAWVPVDDDVVVSGTLEESLPHGLGVPVLSGATLHEFTFPQGDLEGRSAVDLLREAGMDAGLAEAYRAEHADLPDELIPGQLLTDLTFREPLYHWTRERIRQGAGARTWTYNLAYPGPSGLSTHCMELPFVFDVLREKQFVPALLGKRPPQALADAMHGAWVRFIRDGDPGWASSDGGEGMLFDTISTMAPIDRGESVLHNALH